MDGIRDLMKNFELSKHVLQYAKPEPKVSLKFVLAHEVTTPINQAGELRIDRMSQTYTFDVKSAFYNNLSPEKKQKLCNICSLLFKMKLLKSRRVRQLKHLPTHVMETVWKDGLLDIDIFDFINRHLNQWKRYIYQSGTDYLQSRTEFNTQVDHEHVRRNMQINEYKMLFCHGENRDGYSPSPANSYFPRFIAAADGMKLILTDQFLIRARYSPANQIGYIQFEIPERIKKWYLDYAAVIGGFICKLNNRYIHTLGAETMNRRHENGNLVEKNITEWKWEYYDRLNKNEQAENWKTRAFLARSINPVPGSIAKMSKINLKF